MTGPARFRVTYDVTTPESAAAGDIAESGFIDSHGWQWPIAETRDAPHLVALTLRQAVDLCPGPLEDSGRWFSEADGRTCYRSGSIERRALHPPGGITAASYARLARLVEARPC